MVVDGNMTAGYDYSIIDISDRVIISGYVDSGDEIDMTALRSGAYLLRLESDGLGILTKKLIKR